MKEFINRVSGQLQSVVDDCIQMLMKETGITDPSEIHAIANSEGLRIYDLISKQGYWITSKISEKAITIQARQCMIPEEEKHEKESSQ